MVYVTVTTNWGTWYVPVIPLFEKPRKEDFKVSLHYIHRFQANLDNIVRLSHKIMSDYN